MTGHVFLLILEGKYTYGAHGNSNAHRYMECGDLSPLSQLRKLKKSQSGDKSPHSKGALT